MLNAHARDDVARAAPGGRRATNEAGRDAGVEMTSKQRDFLPKNMMQRHLSLSLSLGFLWDGRISRQRQSVIRA